MNLTNYEEDFVRWSEQQTLLLKERKFNLLDLENIIDEIESLGKRDKSKIERLLTCLFETLLKLKYSGKEICYRGWDAEASHLKKEIRNLLKDSPSLHDHLHEISHSCYESALEQVNIIYEFHDFSAGLDFEKIVDTLSSDNEQESGWGEEVLNWGKEERLSGSLTLECRD